MELLHKKGAAQPLPDLPFAWDATSAPTVPFSLPISVKLRVTGESLQIHAHRTDTVGELLGMGTDVDETLALDKASILGVEIFLMPDVPPGDDDRWVENDLSEVVIRHKDPFGVEDFFESRFSSGKAYWPKALAKVLREQWGLDVQIVNEDSKLRKLRLSRGQPSEKRAGDDDAF